MNEVINFVKQFYKEIIALALLLINLGVSIFKKKVKINDVFEDVLLVLPDLISTAESKYKDGASKYSYVFNRCIEMLTVKTGKRPDIVLKEFTGLIDSAIEKILAAPQKKER